jgi:hypothetical protein
LPADQGLGGRLSLSANGRFAAFVSEAINLVRGDTNGWADVFVHDRKKGTTERVTVGPNGRQANFDSIYPSIRPAGASSPSSRTSATWCQVTVVRTHGSS